MNVHVVSKEVHWQDFINDNKIGKDNTITKMSISKARDLLWDLGEALQAAADEDLLVIVSPGKENNGKN